MNLTNQSGYFTWMQHRVMRIDAQFSVQRLLVLNPDGGDTTAVGTGDVGCQAVANMNGLAWTAINGCLQSVVCTKLVAKVAFILIILGSAAADHQ